jgi:uroporphyrinogen decarboxylase
MTPRERVLAACQFRRPDRIPRFESFWEYPDSWQKRLGDRDALTDIVIWYPDETPFPTRTRRLKEEGGYVYEVDAWGRAVRRREGAYFVETLESAVQEGADLDAIVFDSPSLDFRYLTGKMDPSVTFGSPAKMQEALRRDKAGHCVFGKTGGPYLRSTYLRGEAEFLMDMAADPGAARALAEKTAEHLAAVGLEQLRRWDLYETGIWIYDDMAGNRGPMFSPRQFETVLLAAYRRMVRAYKEAGARYVFLHSDGDIRCLLEMLVDAGIDGINPLERRANMDLVRVRERFPRLVLVGGMCNTRTLVRGTREEIEAEAREIIDLGRDGGVVIGTHSISPEVPLENFGIYHRFCVDHGAYGGAQV